MNKKGLMDFHTERTLDRLANTFTVRDLMIELSDLVRANSESEALELLERYPDFDVIPIPKTGTIKAYVSRENSKKYFISSGDLMSDGTSLLELPGLLKERQFYFVLSGTTICGFIHFSDLNKSQMKLPLFVLLEAVERRLWAALKNSGKSIESDLVKVLDPQRAEGLKKKWDKAKKNDVNAEWAGLLNFGEIILFGVHYGLTDLASDKRLLLTKIRNRVVHSDKLLVEKHKDTQELEQTREVCRLLLSNNYPDSAPKN